MKQIKREKHRYRNAIERVNNMLLKKIKNVVARATYVQQRRFLLFRAFLYFGSMDEKQIDTHSC